MKEPMNEKLRESLMLPEWRPKWFHWIVLGLVAVALIVVIGFLLVH